MRKSFLVLFALICCVFNAYAFDFQAENGDGVTIYYNIKPSNKVHVTNDGVNSYSGVVNIPEVVTYDETTYTVTGISANAFEGCDGLTAVTMPSTINNIGNEAFKGCSALVSITIPDVSISYGTNILEGCSSLETFDVPRHMAYIPEAFFKNCSSLTTITYTNSLMNIAWGAFEGCVSLTSANFNIPSTVVYIGYGAFKGCTGLTSVTIPNGVSKIDNDTFKGCSNLVTVNLPSTIAEIKVRAFRDCVNMTTINFPAAMTKIGIEAFYGCTSLTNVDMSESAINYIDNNAFENCTSLTNVVFSNVLTSIGQNAFKNSAISQITLPKSMTTIGDLAFAGCSSLTSAVLPSTITGVGAQAFLNCSGITTLKCFAKVPPSAPANCFDGVNPAMDVIVPCPSVNAYKANIPWEAFNVICAPDINITTGTIPFDSGNIFGEGLYTTDETVNLVAVPKNHFVFVHWTENDVVISTNPSLTFIATENRHIVAHFTYSTHNITVTAEPSIYGSVTGGGMYEYSAVARLEAFPNPHYDFYNWTENDSVVSTEAMYRFTVPYDRNLVAHFGPSNYNVTTIVNIPGAGTTTGDGVYTFNTSVTVTASANEHYTFTCWKEKGVVVSTNAEYTFTINNPRNLTAVFTPDDYEINATVNIEDAGTVEGAGTYQYNTTATLVATSNYSYTFLGWEENGTIVNTNPTYSFTVNSNRNLVAVFGLNNYIVTATSNIGDAAIISGDGIYIHGDTVTMSTYANSFYVFDNWTEEDEVVSTSSAFSFVINSNRNLVANYHAQNTNYWVPTTTASSTMLLTGVIQIEGVEQSTDMLEIGAFCNEEVRGSQKPQLVEATGRYLFYMTIYGNDDDQITFRLYDHENDSILSLKCLTDLTFTTDQMIGSTANPQVMNFISALFITVNVNPENSGTVTGGGAYTEGSEVTLVATPADGFSFNNWMENDTVVTTNATYSFTAMSNRVLTANFVPGNHWNPNPELYNNSMNVIALLQISGEEQSNTFLEVGAFCNDVVRGSTMPTYIASVDKYLYFLQIYGSNGNHIVFKLYDHENEVEYDYVSASSLTFSANSVIGNPTSPYIINMEPSVTIETMAYPANAGNTTGSGIYPYGSTVTLTASGTGNNVFVNWTSGGNVVSTSPTFSFTATESLTFTANFSNGQKTNLSNGWNWYSTFIEMNGVDGLTMIENGLGTSSTTIMSQTQSVVYNGGAWDGSLETVVNEQMYRIYMNGYHTLRLYGNIANPSSHPITLNPDWNWIGYPMTGRVAVNTALARLDATNGDVIRSLNSYAEYIDGAGWIGSLNTLVPGQGYMYNNAGSGSKTFVYQSSAKEDPDGNITTDNNFWHPDVHKYANSMCITSSIVINGERPRSMGYEIGAFCDGECRGSARPVYIEHLDEYIMYLIVYGEQGDEISFKLYDYEQEEIVSDHAANVLSFNNNSVVGSAINSFEISYNDIDNVGENNISIGIYPNPAHIGDKLILTTKAEDSKVEIYNATGVKIYEKTFNNEEKLDCFDKSGVYLMRVITPSGTTFRKVVID